MSPHLKTFLRAALAGITALLLTSAFATDSSQHKVVHGIAIYLGVFPAELILGHPTEAEMHGGVPAGQHQYYVVVALFDNATGKRISGAKVLVLAGALKHKFPDAYIEQIAMIASKQDLDIKRRIENENLLAQLEA